MKLQKIAMVTAVALAFAPNVFAKSNKPVGITPTMNKIEFTHNGKKHVIMRNQDNKNTINPDFAKTSRPCPVFCIQPQVLIPGVETIAELEVIDYVKKMAGGDSSILVVDSRTPNWVKKGTIPGAINVPWTKINPKKGATTDGIIKVMTGHFGAKLKDGMGEIELDEAVTTGKGGSVFDYSNAKTLVMFCNGMWCGQSPSNIKDLVKKFDYPKDKIKWYRGGMQDWNILGLSTVSQ